MGAELCPLQGNGFDLFRLQVSEAAGCRDQGHRLRDPAGLIVLTEEPPRGIRSP